MRIAHVSDFFLPRLGGIEMQVADLAARQAARGDDVTVVTTSSGAAADDPPGVTVRRLAAGSDRAVRPLTALSGARQLAREPYDVVHVHLGIGSPLSFLAANAAVRRGLPVAATVHSFWNGYTAVYRPLDLVGGWSRLPIAWSAVSDAAGVPVRRLMGDDVAVLPNGTDVGAWRVPREPVLDRDVLLVAVMRLAPRKRPLPLLDAVADVRRRLPDDVRLRLVIAGDGPSMSAVRRRVARRGLQDVVELAGRLPRDQIRRLYRRADAFVAPAVLESFGIAALEARCAGVPVVARSGTGVASFVTHDVDGLLADSDAHLADAIWRLAVDRDLRARLRTAPVPHRFDWPAVLCATDELYAQAGAPLPAHRPVLRLPVAVPAGRGEATA